MLALQMNKIWTISVIVYLGDIVILKIYLNDRIKKRQPGWYFDVKKVLNKDDCAMELIVLEKGKRKQCVTKRKKTRHVFAGSNQYEARGSCVALHSVGNPIVLQQWHQLTVQLTSLQVVITIITIIIWNICIFFNLIIIKKVVDNL